MRGRGSARMVLVCCLELLHPPHQTAGRASGCASAFHLPGTAAGLPRAAGSTSSPKAAPGAASAFSSTAGIRRRGGDSRSDELPAASSERVRQGGSSRLPNLAGMGSSTALSGSKFANAIFRGSGSNGSASYGSQGAAGIQRNLMELAQPLLSCIGVMLKAVSPSPLEMQFFLRLLVAASVGMFIGTERRTSHRPAGVRTMSLVALGACTFTLVSQFGFVGRADQARVAASVASGVGFIGAGVITTSGKEASMRDSLSLRGRGGNNFPGTTTSMNDVDGEVKGLTTASAIWITAGLGMACGAGLFFVATLGAGLTVGILKISEVITSLQTKLIRVRSILRPKLAQKLEEEAKAAEAKENEGKASDNDGREAEENEEKEKEKEEEKKRKEEEEEKRKEEEEEKRLKMAEKEKEEALAERMLENVEHAYDPFYGRPWGTEVPKVPLARSDSDNETAEPPLVSGPTRRTLSRSRVLASRKKRRDENRTRGLHVPIGSSPDLSLEASLPAASVSATAGRRRVEDPVLARSAMTVGDAVISEKRMEEQQKQKREDKREQQRKQPPRQQKPEKAEQQKLKQPQQQQQQQQQQPSKKQRKPKKPKKQQQSGAKKSSLKDNDPGGGGATGATPAPAPVGGPAKSPRSSGRARRQSGGGGDDNSKGISPKPQRGERGEVATTALQTRSKMDSDNGGGRSARVAGEGVQKEEKRPETMKPSSETAAKINGEDRKADGSGGSRGGAVGDSEIKTEGSIGQAAVANSDSPKKTTEGSPAGRAASAVVVAVTANLGDAPGGGGRNGGERREGASSRGATTSLGEGSAAVGRAGDATAAPAGGGAESGGDGKSSVGKSSVAVSEAQKAVEARAKLADEWGKGKELDGSRDSGVDL